MEGGIEKILTLEKGRLINKYRKEHPILQELFWECTLRCNLNCRHCGSDCKSNDTREEMPLNDFLQVLDEIKTNSNNSLLVITTGGEPLLRKDIIQCGKEITKRGFYWGLVTNGMLLNDSNLKELLTAGLSSLSISLDGLREEHNWMRRNEKSYDKVIDAIHLLTQSNNTITWDVITCVNRRNLHQLNQIKELLIHNHVPRWRIFTVFPSGRATNDLEMQLTHEQLMNLMDFIVCTRRENSILVNYGCESFLGPYEMEVRDAQYFCAAGINIASVLHDGSISGCLSIRSEYSQGNIYKDSFLDVWNNRFQLYRDATWKKQGACKTCEVWRWCEGNGIHLRDDEGKLKRCIYRLLFHPVEHVTN